jgi:hypothetical protein
MLASPQGASVLKRWMEMFGRRFKGGHGVVFAGMPPETVGDEGALMIGLS